MHHSFDTKIASTYGVNVAIFLNNLLHWINYNQANKINHHDGLYWTYNTIGAYSKIFPYWTIDQIRTILKNCKKHDLIKIGNYNKHKADKTHWYTLTEKSAKLLNYNMWENSQMDSGKIPNGLGKIPEPIPNVNTDIKPVLSSGETKRTETRSFTDDEVEKFYPSHENQKLADKIASSCRTTGEHLIRKFKDLTKRSNPNINNLDNLFTRFLSLEKNSKRANL